MPKCLLKHQITILDEVALKAALYHAMKEARRNCTYWTANGNNKHLLELWEQKYSALKSIIDHAETMR